MNLGDGNNGLFIDASLDDALSAAAAAAGASLVFQGGAGQDTLGEPTTDSAWNITGPDAGTLNGHIAFAGVENLVGAAGNQDTFRLSPGANLSGLMDGGAGALTASRSWAEPTPSQPTPSPGRATAGRR